VPGSGRDKREEGVWGGGHGGGINRKLSCDLNVYSRSKDG